MNKEMILKKLEKIKGKRELEPTEQGVKVGLMKSLRKLASDSMADELKGMKKVTVAAEDDKGLLEGLDKAEDVLEEKTEEVVAEDEAGEEMMEDCSEEELDRKIAELVARKEALKKV